MAIELGRNYDVVHDETGLVIGTVMIEIGEDGVALWTGVLIDGTVVDGIVKRSPAGHYRLMSGGVCVGTISGAGAVNGPAEGEDSPWGGPATLA
jgi:hypothetical protein